MPQIILYEWKIIFSGSLLHKTPTPWLRVSTFLRKSHKGIFRNADQPIRRFQRLGTFRYVIVKSLPSYTAIASDHQTDDRPI